MNQDALTSPSQKALQKENAELRLKVAVLEERCRMLEDQTKLNSSNSSKPPSSDGYQKPNKKTGSEANLDSSQEKPCPKSLREVSGKKAGGQKGHKGVCLKQVEHPDFLELHTVDVCQNCYSSLSDIKVIRTIERQVFEPGKLGQLEVTAHRAEIKVCHCGHRNKAEFPPGVITAVQYGSTTKALAVYLNQYHFVPFQRVSEYFQSVYGMSVSAGSVVNFVSEAHKNLSSTEDVIRDALKKALVAGADETGMRVDGALYWLHIMRNEDWTFYYLSEKRGCEAIDAMGLLLTFTGVLVHDHWKPYFTYAITHVLCNAHHLRELQGAVDRDSNILAFRLMSLLRLSWHYCKGFKQAGMLEVPEIIRRRIESIYDRILERALLKETAFMEKQRQALGRKKVKNTKSYNLFKRLVDFKSETLRFMTDFSIPFDNNGSERDARMAKVKQKVSGCFRSEDGGSMFTRIRSYLSSAKKQGKDVFQSILKAIRNYNNLPLLGAE